LKNRLGKRSACGCAGNGRRPATEKQDAEAFAAEVVEVTEQVVESEQPQAVVESPALRR
jgi:hypothetical protein